MIQDASNNSINVVGQVVSDLKFSHEVYDEKFYNFFVELPRLSEISDVVPVTISEKLVDERLFKPGCNLNIWGQVRTYNNYQESDNKNKLILTIFTRDIKLVDSQLYDYNPNEVYLDGYICKPPVYRTTPFGREISDILLAVNRSFKKSDYIPCITWGRNAKFASRLSVGERVRINGRMQSRKYQKKYTTGEVVEKTAYEISVSKLELASQPM